MTYAILMTYMLIPQFYGKFLAHPCMAFTNLKSAYVTTRVIGVINMEEKCGLRKNVQISVKVVNKMDSLLCYIHSDPTAKYFFQSQNSLLKVFNGNNKGTRQSSFGIILIFIVRFKQ